MAKVLLVEDDNNLREIYEARLQAEGYQIVSAKDGEEGLAVAKKERPDLVIADVMMARISGFEMLDILRNTEGMKELKVIMLTALGQAEDKARADSLGADRYLVKSQVTLEDIVKAVAELLNGAPAAPAVAAAQPAVVTTPPVAIPVAVTPAPAAAPVPAASIPMAPAPAPVLTSQPVITPPVAPVPAPAPVAVVPAPDPVAPPAPTASPPEPITPPEPPAAPAPPDPTPAPQPDPQVSNESDQLMADAVDDLVASVPSAPPEPQAPAPTPPAPEPPTPPEPLAPGQISAAPLPAPTPAPDNSQATVSNTPEPDDVVRRKVISPLGPGQASFTPDLTALLAKEGITNMDDSAHVSASGPMQSHPPGHVISPNPTGADGHPLDPNKISL